jgi:hypothetical protein
MTTSIELNTITLEAGKNFNNFVSKIPVQNFLTSEEHKPTVVKVVDVKDGKVGQEVDKTKYQKQVDEVLEKMKNPNQTVDYKALSEKQSQKISEMESRFAMFEETLKKMEAGNGGNDNSDDRKALEDKANELEITFRSNIGDDKLLEKINAIEPNFKLKE